MTEVQQVPEKTDYQKGLCFRDTLRLIGSGSISIREDSLQSDIKV